MGNGGDPDTMTFKELVALEPKLAELEQDIKGHAERNRKTPKYCANAWWYGYPHAHFEGFKGPFVKLVGILVPEYKHPMLRTSKAYDVAYHHLYSLLPNCRSGCACQTFQHPGNENLIR
jgi:hypothetical protein